MGLTWCAMLVTVAAVTAQVQDSAPSAPTMTREQMETLLGDALAAYDRGIALLAEKRPDAGAEFRDAAMKLELLQQAGVRTAALNYNLGNAYVQDARIGDAILAYRRAEQLAPSDSRIRENLAYARSLRIDQFPESGGGAIVDRLLVWRHVLAWSTRILGASALYVVAWAMMIAGTLLKRRGPRQAAIPVAILAIVLGLSCAYDWWRYTWRPDGVVLEDGVVVRKGNGEGFEPAFQERLHQGTEFTVIEPRGTWLLIELPDGSEGWVRRDQVGLVTPDATSLTEARGRALPGWEDLEAVASAP